MPYLFPPVLLWFRPNRWRYADGGTLMAVR